MSRTNATNFTRLTLADQTGPTDLSFDVDDTTGAPDAPFYAVINLRDDTKREVVRFTHKTGTTLSCATIGDRYLQGSAASSGITHEAAAQIVLAPVSQNLEDIWDEIDNLDTDDVPEGSTNLYYTDGRADARIAGATITAAQLENLNASKINAGVFDSARIPKGVGPSFQTSTASTVTLNFSTGEEIVRSTRAGTLAFAGSNYTAGVTKTVIWSGGSSSRSVSFPAGWKFVSFKPSSIAANKTGVLAVTSFGNSESDVVAAWAVEA